MPTSKDVAGLPTLAPIPGVTPAATAVFTALARAAVEICGGGVCGVFVLAEGKLHFVADHNFSAEAVAAYRRDYPVEPTPTGLVAGAILSGLAVNLADITQTAGYYSRAGRGELGYRSVLITPVMSDGAGFAAFGVGRMEAVAFPPEDVARMAVLSEFAAAALRAAGFRRT